MGKYRTLQTAFNGGEYDPKLRSRSDIKSYFQGALSMLNTSLLSHGGFFRRYGSGITTKVDVDGRLIPFEYSATEALIIFLRNGGQAEIYGLDGTLVATLSGGGWSLSQLNDITYEQRGNAIFLAHRSWPTKIIRRTSATTFTMTEYEFYTTPGTGKKNQPYSNVNQDKSILFTVSSLNTGSVTLTSNIAFFTPAMVGVWFSIGDDGFGYITGYTSSTSVTYQQLSPPTRELLTDPLQVNEGSSIGTITMVAHGFSKWQVIRLSGFLETGGVDEETINRSLTIIEIVDENTFKVDFSQQVDPENPDNVNTLDGDWLRQAGLPPLANSGSGWFYMEEAQGIFAISARDDNSNDVGDDLQKMNSGTSLRVTDKALPGRWMDIEFTGAPTYSSVSSGDPDYLRVNAKVSQEGVDGQPTDDGTECLLGFTTTGVAPGGDGAAEDTYTGGGLLCKVEYTGPSPDWRIQSFCDYMGYPGVVALHQERLFFASTLNEPDAIFATKVRDLDVFDLGDGYPTDSIQVTLDSGRVNEIRHMVSSRHLQIFTNDAEFYMATPESENVTPENATIRKQTPYGCSTVKATEFDGATIFFQGSGRSVREFLYTDREYAYAARDIAVLSQHLIKTPVDTAAIYGSYDRPEKYLFVVNGDGTMAVLHMIREEEMIGWTPWETDGDYKSVISLQRRIFTLVERDGEFFIEEFDQSSATLLDAVEYLSASGSHWGPSEHYAGKTVSVIQNGFYEGEFEVSADGYITPNHDGWSNVVIGRNFSVVVKSMPQVVTLPDGTLVGLPLRLTRVVVDLEETSSLYVDDQRLDNRNTLDSAATPGGYDTSERVEFRLQTVDRTPTFEITQEEPAFCMVYSATVEVAW